METIEFKCILETVPKKEAVVSLFQGADAQESAAEINQEFLLHLEAEIPANKDEKKVQQAEFIVVVDKSGSMQGTPWTQVQGALCKMLDLTDNQANIRCRVIDYNSNARVLPLSSNLKKDKAEINKIRAGGSTSFVSVFRELSAIFKNKKEDSSKAFFVFFMTDGEDTVSNAKEIMKEKELMQTVIEKFGAEVVFHVLGFSEHHDEQFLESLTFLGTSDGTYSFVSPSEGDKAVQERLVALIQTTSSVVGRSLNIEMKSKDLLFLGDTFGEAKAEVVLPAMVIAQGDTVKIATKKFVKKTDGCGDIPKIELKVYEKLTGTPKAIEASVSKIDENILHTKIDMDDHNLMKLRTALNMITGSISEADNPDEVEKMKVWHKLVEEKFSKMNINDTELAGPMLNRKKAVQAGIKICKEIYEEGNEQYSDRERNMKQQAAMNSYQFASNQVQNRRQVKSKAAGMNQWLSSKASRSSLQKSSKMADYAPEDFVMVDEPKKK